MNDKSERIAPYLDKGSSENPEALRLQEEKLREVFERILKHAQEKGATVRAVSSLAYRIRCPNTREIAYENGQKLGDIDLACPKRDILQVLDTFEELGWKENITVMHTHGNKRRIFHHPDEPLHADIFIDKLRFCHDIDLRGRFDKHDITTSLADMLLEKLQIAEINRKDIVNILILLAEHGFGHEGIDRNYLAKLFASDWGLYKTSLVNIEKLSDHAETVLEGEQKEKVKGRLGELRKLLDRDDRTIGWKLRDLIGERVKWYKDVEEVQRD
ncbi:MAG: hypothetical protein U5N86_02240 [Planctomycetota bacterium]|nr:hypothetical protein [Planctomycetota bacterium]